MSWMSAEIAARGGQVTFRDFMDLALYHPLHGYYSAREPRYGRSGDYLTAPTASRWYAAVMARCCRMLASRLGPITVVDMASGDGSFMIGLARELAGDVAKLTARMVAVERSETMRRVQGERFAQERLEVDVRGELAAAEHPGGAVLVHACELYDALPVHRVVARDGGLEELAVGTCTDGLEWRQVQAPAALVQYFASHGVQLDQGQLAEVNAEAEPRHRELLGWAGSEALVIVLDYGYEAGRLYDPRGRRFGSLACYRDHRLSRDPLADPGDQDISAHVNWDDLRRAAAAAGCAEVALWSLAELLLRGGLQAELERLGYGEEADLTADVVAERQEIKRLLDPEGMGSDLKALIHGCGASLDVAREIFATPGL